MRIILEAVAGPHRGRKVVLREGETVKIGRTELADFAFPRDGRMSGLHFDLSWENKTCRLKDLNSANGTFVNSKPADEALLAKGDEIRAGQTLFAVHIEGLREIRPPQEDLEDGDSSTTSGPIPSIAAAVADTGTSEPFRTALADENPGVRREALLAAAWTRQPWLIEHCRRACEKPIEENWDAIYLLAILAAPDHLEQICEVARSAELGAYRFDALGAFGHPAVVDLLLEGIGGSDPPAAVAAGNAFTRITGADVESDQQVQLSPEGGSEPGEPEQEFPDEAFLPSLERAREHWNQVKGRFSPSVRLCRGLDLSRQATPEILAQLDMQSRWEAYLRGRFQKTWGGKLADLEAFPSRKLL